MGTSNTAQKLVTPLKTLALLCFLSYLVYGIYFNVIGSNATVMMSFFEITEAEQGFILTMQSIGALLATFFIALWGERFNKINMTAIGILLMGAGALLIGIVPQFADPGAGYYMLIMFVLVAGVGFTFIDVMVNSMMPDVFSDRSDTLVPVAHSFHGIGSMLAPLFVTALVNPEILSTFGVPYAVLGVASAVVFALFVAFGKKITPFTPYVDMAEKKKRVRSNPAEIFKQKESWILLAAGITYFAFQIGVSSWLPTFCIQDLGMEYKMSGTLLTMFFAGALAMRLVTPFLLKKIKAKHLYFVFGFASAVCLGIALFVNSIPAATALITISGFLQGAHATFLVIMACATFPDRTASASSLVTMSIGVSSLIFPYIMGLIADYSGLRGSLMLIVIGFIISSLIIFFLGRKSELR